MIQLALYQPEIPPNTGNIIRLCANAGATLHLIHPLGFSLDEKQVRRAGLDYHEWVNVQQHADYASFLDTIKPSHIFACTTKASTSYTDVTYPNDALLLFGPETRGLPNDILTATMPPTTKIRIPMQAKSRSLNLSNAAAIVLYEAWRQRDFQ